MGVLKCGISHVFYLEDWWISDFSKFELFVYGVCGDFFFQFIDLFIFFLISVYGYLQDDQGKLLFYLKINTFF